MKIPFHIPGLETYYGGKAGTSTPHVIINQIPQFRGYVELFTGSGAIFRHLHFEPGDKAMLNEIIPSR